MRCIIVGKRELCGRCLNWNRNHSAPHVDRRGPQVRRTGGKRHWCPFWVRLSGCGRRVVVIKPNEDPSIITKIEGGRCTAAFIQFVVRRCVELFVMRAVEDHAVRFAAAAKSYALHTPGF